MTLEQAVIELLSDLDNIRDANGEDTENYRVSGTIRRGPIEELKRLTHRKAIFEQHVDFDWRNKSDG